MDVVGDTMLERLGLRAALRHCRLAATLGVSRFDCRLGDEHCSRVAHPRQLAGMLTELGKKHGLTNVAALPSC
jgi:hypothetical protein